MNNIGVRADVLARIMYDRGQCVFEFSNLEGSLANLVYMTQAVPGYAFNTAELINQGIDLGDIQVGDLVFFAERWSDGIPVATSYSGYKDISHVAIVTGVKRFDPDMLYGGGSVKSGSYNEFMAGYYHEITEVSSLACASHFSYSGEVEIDNWKTVNIDDYNIEPWITRPLWENLIVEPMPKGSKSGSPVLAWGGSIVMVCRPDLRVPSMEDNLLVEAQRIGLHEMPKSWGALNVVKRARQCTDVKWMVSGYMDRYSTINGVNPNDIPGTTPWFYPLFVEGTQYVGLPSTDEPRETVLGRDCGLDAFVTCAEAYGTKSSVTGIPAAAWYSDEGLLYVYDRLVPNGDLDSCSDVLSSENDIQLGDWVRDDNSCAVVSDIIRSNGVIESVELCNFTNDGLVNDYDVEGLRGGVAVRQWISFEEFKNKYGEVDR